MSRINIINFVKRCLAKFLNRVIYICSDNARNIIINEFCVASRIKQTSHYFDYCAVWDLNSFAGLSECIRLESERKVSEISASGPYLIITSLWKFKRFPAEATYSQTTWRTVCRVTRNGRGETGRESEIFIAVIPFGNTINFRIVYLASVIISLAQLYTRSLEYSIHVCKAEIGLFLYSIISAHIFTLYGICLTKFGSLRN